MCILNIKPILEDIGVNLSKSISFFYIILIKLQIAIIKEACEFTFTKMYCPSLTSYSAG